MKKVYALLTLLALSCSVSSNLSAQQTLRGGYFLDGYNYKYKLNPAFGNDLDFISIPMLGNVNVGTSGNVALSTFLFPNGDGTLNFFMSPNVSNDEFLSGIKDKNLLGLDINTSLFAVGFHAGKTYHTFDVSLKSSTGMNIPGNMLSFIKKGAETASIKDMGVKMNTNLEIAYGFSADITDRVRIGARVKGIIGAAYAEAKLNSSTINANADGWNVSADGTLETGGYMTYGFKDNNAIDYNSLKAADKVVSPSLGGALDLGILIKVTDHLNLSFAATDLGVIKWNNVTAARTPSSTWEFDGFNPSADEDLNDQIDQMVDELGDCFTLYQTGTGQKSTHYLAPIITGGIEYILPSYDKLSFGVLATSKIDGVYSWTEGRISANYAPSRWFSCNLTAAESTFGFSAGTMINFHGKGVNLFLGVDNLLPWTRVSTYGIPVDDMTANITFGLNIAFGKYTGRLPKN